MRAVALLLSLVLALTRGGTAVAAASESTPTNTRFQLGLNIGYLKTPCSDPNYDVPCATGGRAELSLDLVFKERTEVKKAFGEHRVRSEGSGGGGGGGNWIPNGAFSGARSPGDLIAGIIVMILIIAVVFGLIWATMAIVSQKLKLGFYTAQEYFPKRWQTDGIEDYAAQATGFQVGFYLVPDVDLALRASVGVVNAQAVQDDQTYNLHGVEARAGVGFVPFDGTGPMLIYEMDSKQFARGPIQEYLANNLQPKLPAVRRTSSLTAGWIFAF